MAVPSTHHRLEFDDFGDASVLKFRQRPVPHPAAGQALVQVAFAGLNFADVYRRQGNYGGIGDFPACNGFEGAGVVVALGPIDTTCDDFDIAPINVGDRVCWADSPYSNAEYCVVEFAKLMPVPQGISMSVAAALPLQGLTAHYLCHESYQVKRGDVALVHAAAGGVGTLLTQYLRHLGAYVIGLASRTSKVMHSTSIGRAHECLLYEDTSVTVPLTWMQRVADLPVVKEHGGIDVVYESVGTTLHKSLSTLRTGGTCVFFGFAGGDPPSVSPRLLMDNSFTLVGGDLWNTLPNRHVRLRKMNELFEMVLRDEMTVAISASLPLVIGADAHRLIESRTTMGKILLICNSEVDMHPSDSEQSMSK